MIEPTFNAGTKYQKRAADKEALRPDRDDPFAPRAIILKPLPPLPIGESPADAAVRSVFIRRFYDEPNHLAAHDRLTLQLRFLVEEVGEVDEAMLNYGFHDFGTADKPALVARLTDEICDALIVLAQMAWLSGLAPSAVWDAEPTAPELLLTGHLREISKAMRKFDGSDFYAVHVGIISLAERLFYMAPCLKAELKPMFLAKLEADEARGALHAGGELREVVL